MEQSFFRDFALARSASAKIVVQAISNQHAPKRKYVHLKIGRALTLLKPKPSLSISFGRNAMTVPTKVIDPPMSSQLQSCNGCADASK